MNTEGSLLWMVGKVEERVKELVQKFANKFDGQTKLPIRMPTIIYKKRGTTAGTCSYRAGSAILNFNRVIMQENWEEFDQTVVHELAHYCTWLLFPNATPHGRDWKRVMGFFGKPAARCHNYDTSNARVQRNTYTYKCACTTFQLSSIRHSRIQKGTKYHCKKCKTTLALAV